jgi:hypothetical protein
VASCRVMGRSRNTRRNLNPRRPSPGSGIVAWSRATQDSDGKLAAGRALGRVLVTPPAAFRQRPKSSEYRHLIEAG